VELETYYDDGTAQLNRSMAWVICVGFRVPEK